MASTIYGNCEWCCWPRKTCIAMKSFSPFKSSSPGGISLQHLSITCWDSWGCFWGCRKLRLRMDTFQNPYAISLAARAQHRSTSKFQTDCGKYWLLRENSRLRGKMSSRGCIFTIFLRFSGWCPLS